MVHKDIYTTQGIPTTGGSAQMPSGQAHCAIHNHWQVLGKAILEEPSDLS